MKSIIKDFAKVSYALLILLSAKTFAQESISLKITPELSKQVMEKYNLEDFKIYSVTSKEVEYYPYVDGQVVSVKYNQKLEELKRYQSGFDEYNNALKVNEDKREAIKTISQNIDAFLASDEKYDIKEKMLIESQELADKYKITVTLLRTNINDPIRERRILLYEAGKKANKNDLKSFKDEIRKIKISEPNKTSDYIRFMEAQSELSRIPKAETGKVLSDKPSRKTVYIASEPPVELSILSGNFTKLPEKYMLISDEIAGKIAKNELITESNEHFVNNLGFRGLSIFKKSGTNELYYITSDRFIGQLEIELNQIAYKNLGTNSEYKTWKVKYVGLLQSARVNVNACDAIIAKHTYLNRIGQKRYDSATFTKQEKITFNKNLDLMNDKLSQIGELEANRDYLQYYNDKASTKEAAESYSLASYYNSTSRVY